LNAIQAMETELGRKLGVLSRVVAYHHLLPHKPLIMHCMSRAPKSEQKWFGMGYPLFAWLMRKAMNIDAHGAERATKTIHEIFDTVASQAHGEFLIGNHLTIADVSLAALGAPLVLPDKYGAPLPNLEDLPTEVQSLCEILREHPTGQRILRVYTEHR
jgi:glutathione S-transferase